MSFDLKKKRKRKVSRSRKTKSEPQKVTLDLISVSDKLPVQDNTAVLVWENTCANWYVSNGSLVCQHYYGDLELLGYSRVRYWAYLD